MKNWNWSNCHHFYKWWELFWHQSDSHTPSQCFQNVMWFWLTPVQKTRYNRSKSMAAAEHHILNSFFKIGVKVYSFSICLFSKEGGLILKYQINEKSYWEVLRFVLKYFQNSWSPEKLSDLTAVEVYHVIVTIDFGHDFTKNSGNCGQLNVSKTTPKCSPSISRRFPGISSS